MLFYLWGEFGKNGAFTGQYDFMKSPDQETRFVIAVNTIAPIELTKQLAKNLAKSDNPRAIFIGTLSGLDNSPSIEVANNSIQIWAKGSRPVVETSSPRLQNWYYGH